VPRIPLLADSRIVVADVDDADVVLRPPPAREALEDVPAAVTSALAFPLAGEPLERLATRGGSATVVIEQPSLPIPAAAVGPRHIAIAAVVDELERLGVANVTILVAGGLLRRTSPREIGLLVTPEFRRRFKGRVVVHDAEAEDLVELGRTGNASLRVNPALVETDLVVTVTAAETVLHGGPASLLAATGRESLRAAGALSAARDQRVAGLAPRPRDRTVARATRSRHRRLARAQQPAHRRPVRGLPARPTRDRPDARVTGPPRLPARAGAGTPADPRAPAAGADRGRRVRRGAVGARPPRRSPPARSSAARNSPSRSTRS